MSKVIEITEFQSIVCESDKYEKYPGYEYLPEDIFREFERFVKEFTSDAVDNEAIDFFSIGFKKHVGETITAKNYVGLIEFQSGNQIQILPKLDLGESQSDTKTVFLRMLCSMKDFPAKVFKDAGQKAANMNLYEIFIKLYIDETIKLVKHGLKSAYIREEDNLNVYKGKLMVNEHIKRNIVHKENFYVAFDEYQINRAENRLIKSTLMKLRSITSDANNEKAIRQLLTSFELVEPSKNYIKDFSKVSIDRNTKDYEILMKWSKVFLMNKSFSTFSGSTTSRSLLFPMEKVYESYVAQKMKKVFGPDGWSVSSQDSRYHLFESPRKFSLRPDIVMKKGDITIVLDTKWKRLINDPNKNYGISQGDMYQMYAYSKKYKTSEIWLLYPLNNEMKDHEPIVFDSGDDTFVRIHFVDVDLIEDNLEELKKEINFCLAQKEEKELIND